MSIFIPKLELSGSKTITLECKENYSEEGYKIKYPNLFSVIVNNNTNFSKVGEYYVNYTAKSILKIRKKTIKRKVIIVDTKNPKISLTEGDEIYAFINTEFKDPGYTAYDECDMDITKNVTTTGNVDTSKIGKYKILYEIKDSSGNIDTAERTINITNKNTNGIPVLMYHFFYDKNKSKSGTGNHLEIHRFEEQIKYLKENNYYFPSWDELDKYIDDKLDLPEKSVILTADDGDRSFYELAVPILEKYGVPATSFVVSYRGTWKSFKDKTKNITYGSHTNNLHDRTCKGSKGAGICISYDKLNADLKTAQETLNNAEAFAYPFGHYNSNFIKALKENNFKVAFTTNEGRVKKKMNKYLLPRIRISSWQSLSDFKSKVK